MRSFRLASAIIVPLAILACQTGLPPGAKKLDAAEIRDRMVNMTTYTKGQDNRDYMSYAAPDGTIRLRGGDFFDKGTYRIEADGRLCLKWEVIRDGVETCQTVWSANGKDYFVLPDGNVSSVAYKRAAGNPEHL